ncbi:ABC transporter permease [Gorillibacterium sp. CAU 1737]|uniref:ABC transporter permease n=1 Tax=Gorillibacterium sp. CAU 1737 TaxID=3140362 RepID=UPI003260493F
MSNSLRIAWKEIKTTLRNRFTFLLMIAFPIAMMTVLGFALSENFSSEPSLDRISIVVQKNVNQDELRTAWDSFEKGMAERGVNWTENLGRAESERGVTQGRYTAYLDVNDKGIRYTSRHSGGIEDNIVEGMLSAFVDRYNLAVAAFQESPELGMRLTNALSAEATPIKESSINPNRSPGSMDYYAMAMSTMIAFYAATTSTHLIQGERARKTDSRLMSSPLTKAQLFVGKVLGATLINTLFVLVVVLFSRFVFHADWGGHYGVVLALLMTEVLLSVSIGLAAGYLFKKDSSTAVMIILTQVVSFLGGAYFPLSQIGGFLGSLTWLSPLRWANHAMIEIIYNDRLTAAIQPITLNLALAALFLFISAVSLKRKEGL